jgi:hypothetical protein
MRQVVTELTPHFQLIVCDHATIAAPRQLTYKGSSHHGYQSGRGFE